MSLEDEVDQNTAKAIAAAAEANGGSHPATEPIAAAPAGSQGPARTPGPQGPAGTGLPGTGLAGTGLAGTGPAGTGTRPAAPLPGSPVPSRGAGTGAPSPAGPAQAKQPSAARSAIIDTEDHTEGIRLMPGADN
jgi:hypothetical protein